MDCMLSSAEFFSEGGDIVEFYKEQVEISSAFVVCSFSELSKVRGKVYLANKYNCV